MNDIITTLPSRIECNELSWQWKNYISVRLNPILTGDPLSEIYIGSDGLEEQIYENVVIYRDYASPGGIALRPLPALLEIPGYEPQANTPEINSGFVAPEGTFGFYVPAALNDYIQQNYGYLFIGHPITNYEKINNDLYRQCFENLCLDHHPNIGEGRNIHPKALGRMYKGVIASKYTPDDGVGPFTEITLSVQEISPVIYSGQEQKIRVLVLDKGIPVSLFGLSLNATLPNGSSQIQRFHSTNQAGITTLSLDPIEASRGISIKYEICAENVEETVDCITGEYLIWGESPQPMIMDVLPRSTPNE